MVSVGADLQNLCRKERLQNSISKLQYKQKTESKSKILPWFNSWKFYSTFCNGFPANILTETVKQVS